MWQDLGLSLSLSGSSFRASEIFETGFCVDVGEKKEDRKMRLEEAFELDFLALGRGRLVWLVVVRFKRGPSI